MSSILLTGATGFIGKALAGKILEQNSHSLVAVVRNNNRVDFPSSVKLAHVADIALKSDWSSALSGMDIVIHLAARAHVINDNGNNSLSELRRVNIDGTLNLARQAAAAGVKRFVFLSSIGVNGNSNIKPFTEADSPGPVEPYAQSKLEAEEALQQLSTKTGMEIVIIRPPLVYGPGAPGNFGKLLEWVARGVPLPLGSTHNLRSYVGLDNLVDFIVTCIDHPAAANEVFLVSDGEDLSTTELLRRTAVVMGKPARLVPIPPRLLAISAAALGKRDLARRLLGSLRVDISKAREVLGWEPPISVDEGLKRAVGPLL
ncbi:SDR family oxidoreductase [Thiohalophilus sp.]|uniref:UDP-glucose 4-epimerase family protein n=1 Tax=Thiohalophilus sp. TaxID=3028392 RepID=UPI002ACD3B1B|nr:SDR family oxidoreductase [Thiohalophilus sp.]MDZ7662819.1 SDR family oxidoreductase [Thiohalophilus sp.]